MKNEPKTTENKVLIAKQRGGKKRVVLRENQIYNMASVGCTMKEIAKILNVSFSTIQKKYAEEYDKGQSSLSESIKRTQVKLALAGNVTMLIWLGKQYCGQKDSRQEIEHKADISINVRNFGVENGGIEKYKPSTIDVKSTVVGDDDDD